MDFSPQSSREGGVPVTTVNPGNVGSDTGGKAVASRVLLIGRNTELGEALEEALTERNCVFDYAAGNADALRRLRCTPYSVVITDPAKSIEEDLAMLSEMRTIRPGVQAIVLACSGTPEEIIAALRARVFVCK